MVVKGVKINFWFCKVNLIVKSCSFLHFSLNTNIKLV